jgi:hypothetical protein
MNPTLVTSARTQPAENTPTPDSAHRRPLTASSISRLTHRITARRASAVILERQGFTAKAEQLRASAAALEALIRERTRPPG